MAPSHPLRDGTRVFVARALASVAVFSAIAVLLLSGSEGHSLAYAETSEAPNAAGIVQAAVDPAAPVAEAAPAPPPEAPEPAPPPEAPEPAPPPEALEPTPPPDPAPTEPAPDDPGDVVEEPAAPPSGGGSKEEPADPELPATPPEPTPDVPDAPEAPTGDDPGAGGDPSGGEDDPARPGTGGEEPPPEPTGGGGKPVTDPAASPQGQALPPGQSSDPAPTVPGSDTPTQSQDSPAGTPGGFLTDPDAAVVPVAGLLVAERRLSSGSGGGAGSEGGAGAPGGAAPGGSTPGVGLGATAAPDGPILLAQVPTSSDGAAGGRQGGIDGQPERELSGDSTPAGLAPAVYSDLAGFVNFVPDSIKFALAGLAALCILLGLLYLLAALRNRSLGRQRSELLQEVGLLQTALLPPVPERVGALRTSVAYRPADGPGAGGDFYDVLPLAGGRVGFILGDVSGHGRGALARTAFMRYTLRAYLEAGLEPRVALQVAGRVIDDNLGGDFATVLLAVHDPETGSLTYATAGHPAPLVVGPLAHEPITVASSPPIGVGVRTGLRQTTVPLVPGAVAALFTDGLLEARVDGGMLGRKRLQEHLGALGASASAAGLIESVKTEARVLSDDIAAVVIQPTNDAVDGQFRTEQLELTARELEGPLAARFLEAAGLPPVELEAALYDARTLAERFGGVILHVVFGNRLRVEVLPRNVESLEAASRRAAAR